MTPSEALEEAKRAARDMLDAGEPDYIADTPINTFLAKLEELGMVVVPREATEEMMLTAYGSEGFGEIWSAMISAASPEEVKNIESEKR